MNKKRSTKRSIAVFLCLTLLMGFMLPTPVRADDADDLDTFFLVTDIDENIKNGIDKYGNIVLALTCQELLDSGYNYGDLVNLKFSEMELVLPLCSN